MTDKKTIYLIDGSAYIYRGFHALPPLTNSQGIPTNAALGFLNILTKLLKERTPEYGAIFFDAKGPTFRHEFYSDYKANRPPMPEELRVQLPYVKKICSGYNFKTIEEPGLEADDLMGTIAAKAEAEGFRVVLVTGDKDFMQLVTENVTIYDPGKDVTIDREAVKEKTGVYPEQIIDIMALTGDAADNVPGVAGIGKKTAPALINEFGSLEGLYENIDKVSGKKKKENLENAKDDAFLSKRLVTIETGAEIPFEKEAFKFQEPNREALFELFSELEFKKYLASVTEQKKPAEKTYAQITDRAALEALAEKLKATDIFAIDTETTSIDPVRAELVGLSFSTEENNGWYVPVGHDYPGAPEQLDLDTVREVLNPILESPDYPKAGQNIKYDLIVLKRHGINLAGITFDTMVASYVLNPTKRAHGLDQIAMDLFNHKTISYEEVAGKGKKQLLFSQVPLETATPYACEDADITLMACRVFQKELKDKNLEELFNTVEMPLVFVLAQMEMSGICVDKEALSDLSDAFESEIISMEEKIYELAGEPFNIKSSQQLGAVLFEKLGLPVQKKTKKKTGYSTDADVLAALAPMHDLPLLVLRYRTLTKLKSTYTDALVEKINPETGRIHTSFNQTVTVTGRLSSSDPNLQNIPVSTDEGKMIRRTFIPREGWKLLSADYSQIELRLLAHCSDDQILIESFNNNEDIHTRTASEVFDHHPSLITPELRRQAKAINFGIVYGMSAYGLSKELGITQKMAKTYIDSYFSRYSGVKNFIDSTISHARETCTTATLLGRTRALPEIKSSSRTVQQFAERAAVNTPIQGTAADLIKLAMITIFEELSTRKLKTEMLLSVHDEIIFEVPPEELEEVKQLVKEKMEGVWELSIPLKVNLDTGENWEEAH